MLVRIFTTLGPFDWEVVSVWKWLKVRLGELLRRFALWLDS